jgi:glutaredoxin-like YruB-family protein
MSFTTTTCPKCRYVRQSADVAPAWQCPGCGVAYNKAMSDSYVAPLRARHEAPVERRGGWGKWIMVSFIVYGGYLGFTHPWRGDVQPAAISQAGAQQPEVSLYATSWCPYCAKAREYLRMHGIRYTEYDIEQNAAAEQGYRRLHGNGVPVVVVGEEVIHGYQPEAMEELLRPWLQ